jgi:hypothetical protein
MLLMFVVCCNKTINLAWNNTSKHIVIGLLTEGGGITIHPRAPLVNQV